ncbi:hypothetical protein P4O66_017568 [Electrophorus voltai]|uniref:TLC domain-containing protein n=1 Tax=Electrophorus voltai TaxID=2609070 RepID=A0AAD8YSL5_9TELE|nr:hypothetical protein P4O66_017568 [Electrophorus voltai]
MEGTWLRLHSHPALSVVAFALVFRAVHRLLYSLTPPPRVVERNPLCAWKWRNLCLSLAHSLVTGPWAATCVIVCPEMLKDLHSYSTPISYLLVCVSSAEHAVASAHVCNPQVLWCFLYALYTRRYVGGAVIALLVEINSVTLHTRLLLKLAEARASTVYRINKLLNLLTYVTFRLGTQFYLTWYLLWNYSWLDHAAYFLGTVLLMDIIILIYFYRLLRADFFPSGYACLERNATSSNGFSDFLKD